MKERFYCDICVGAPLKLKDKSYVTRGVKTYRVRKFVCLICGYEKCIYGDGRLDEHVRPKKGVADAQRLVEQDIYNEERPELEN